MPLRCAEHTGGKYAMKLPFEAAVEETKLEARGLISCFSHVWDFRV